MNYLCSGPEVIYYLRVGGAEGGGEGGGDEDALAKGDR